MSSLRPVVDLAGNVFGRTVYPPNLGVVDIILAKSMGWEIAIPSP